MNLHLPGKLIPRSRGWTYALKFLPVWALLIFLYSFGTLRCEETNNNEHGVSCNLVHCRKLIFVRHAEKKTMVGEDDLAPLVEDGWGRARALARKLEHENITKIFVTTAIRTQQTASPLAETLRGNGRSFSIYTNLSSATRSQSMSDFDTLCKIVRSNDVVLVVSHSSRIPALLNELGLANQNADEFGQMWIAVPRANQSGFEFKFDHFGASTSSQNGSVAPN